MVDLIGEIFSDRKVNVKQSTTKLYTFTEAVDNYPVSYSCGRKLEFLLETHGFWLKVHVSRSVIAETQPATRQTLKKANG